MVMSRFEPQPGDRIMLNSTIYEVMPHPAAPSVALRPGRMQASCLPIARGQRVLCAQGIQAPVPRTESGRHQTAIDQDSSGVVSVVGAL
jgi:hypothetical protein